MRFFSLQTAVWLFCIAAIVSCQKELTTDPDMTSDSTTIVAPDSTQVPDTDTTGSSQKEMFTTYTILKGEQYCVNNMYPPYMTDALHFVVKFDSTDIYSNIIATNQYDYNKLYGFSDNMSDHHSFSARFGWRWCNNEVELSAYTYNDGVRSIKDLGGVALNKEHNCAIVVNGNHYDFVLDGDTTSVSRTSKTEVAMGYKLLPYFGGDEMAPHDINIMIKETK